jgi:hypothetical protein
LACDIVLKHIGGPADLFKFRRMQDEWSCKREAFRLEARKTLLAEHGNADAVMEALLPGAEQPTLAWAIEAWTMRQPRWTDMLTERIHLFITEGTAEGASAIEKLWNAGGETLLLKALNDIVIHNDPSMQPPEEGKPTTGES